MEFHWTSGCGRIELTLLQQDLDIVCQSGSNDEAVKAITGLDRIQKQTQQWDTQKLIDNLREYGCWDDGELEDRQTNIERTVWLACWDCHEDPELYLQGSESAEQVKE